MVIVFQCPWSCKMTGWQQTSIRGHSSWFLLLFCTFLERGREKPPSLLSQGLKPEELPSHAPHCAQEPSPWEVTPGPGGAQGSPEQQGP